MSDARLSRRGLLAGAAACAWAPGAHGEDLPDHRLVIAPVKLEIAKNKMIETVGYNGSAPGPLLRLRAGRPVTIDIENQSANDDIVHWHGFAIGAREDGAMEEGSPMVTRGATQRVRFTPGPAGTRWYHSHAMAGDDLTKSLYSGQYGVAIIESANEPSGYDQEVVIALHHWEPFLYSIQDKRPSAPADNGYEVGYRSATFNDRALGFGEPVRVRQGQRVLFRLVNASATEPVQIALPQHRFTVVACDGNPVPRQATLDQLYLAPGERIDAIVAMNSPGVWVFGSVDDGVRAAGMGVVVEYSGESGAPQWTPAPRARWDYTIFGDPKPAPEPDERIELDLIKITCGRDSFNRWSINGKSWPDTDRIRVEQGKRYRLMLRNLAADEHPIHLHRHTFEVSNFLGKTTSGLMKDVVVAPGRRTIELDFIANNPGPSLFHCHMQHHQDFGFMALVEYV